MNPGLFNREQVANVKPLGLDKNKARAALNNLNNMQIGADSCVL